MSERRAWVTQPELRMNAYYFGFSPTGVREIDEILSAVACAGKAFHHTEDWNDYSGGEPSYVELIAEAAERAAASIRGLRAAEAPRSQIIDLEKALRDSCRR